MAATAPAAAAPGVSVVMIFLDAERFIAEAIASVRAQTYTAWELLLVDDGSTDGSSLIAAEFAAAEPDRIRYLVHPERRNRGMSASRNLGIRHSRGAYVALLDADDVWLPGKLAEQVAILDARPELAMVYGATQWWYSWSGRREDASRDFVHDLGVPAGVAVEPPDLLTRFLVDEGLAPCTCSMLVRREVIARVGGFEDSFPGLYEDQVMTAKICLEWPVLALATSSYRYRQHDGSALATASPADREAARARFLQWLAAYIDVRGRWTPEIRHALRGEQQRGSRRPCSILEPVMRLRRFAPGGDRGKRLP